MKTSIVIGLGETGNPLRKILNCAGEDLTVSSGMKQADVMNICIPYSEDFIETVKGYQDKYKPELTIIHTTVPVGTTAKISNAVHSPILGDHTNMEQSLWVFDKWIGGELAEKAKDYLSKYGFKCHCVKTSEETEIMKLMCLAKYGIQIAFAKYQKEIMDKYNLDYNNVFLWDRNYVEGLHELGKVHINRSFIYPQIGPIGGHCVVQNTKLLNEQHPNIMLQEILKHDMATV